MSDDFIDSIWAQFAVETEEHLEAMEQMLVAAESGNIGPEEVARLFRSFHSVKGLSKALDMIGMEARRLGAADVIAKPSGAMSLDLGAKKGHDIVKAVRKAAGLP